MVEHAFNLSTREKEAEAQAGRFLLVQGQPGLCNEFQASQGLQNETLFQKNKIQQINSKNK